MNLSALWTWIPWPSTWPGFDHPEVFWLLALLVPLAVLRLFIRRGRAVALPGLSDQAPRFHHRLRRVGGWFLEVAMGAVVIVLLAGPGTRHSHTRSQDTGLDVAFALDVSITMLAKDMEPNRLDVLKRLTRDFISRSDGDRIGLYAFAKHVFAQCPLTADHETLMELVDGIAYEMLDHGESGGTAIGDAMVTAIDALAAVRQKGRDQILIVVTDGENNHGIDPELAARHGLMQGIRLHVIGMGGEAPIAVYSPSGKPFMDDKVPLVTRMDDTQLRKVAKAGGGTFHRALSGESLAAIFEDLRNAERSPLTVETMTTTRSLRPKWSLALLGLFLLYLILEAGFWRRPLR